MGNRNKSGWPPSGDPQSGLRKPKVADSFSPIYFCWFLFATGILKSHSLSLILKRSQEILQKMFPCAAWSVLLSTALETAGIEHITLFERQSQTEIYPVQNWSLATCPSIPWFLGFPWLTSSKEFPWLFWYFLCLFQRKSLVNLSFFLGKTQKARNGRTGNAIGAFLQTPAPVLDKISGPMGARFLSSTGLGSGNLIGRAQFPQHPHWIKIGLPKKTHRHKHIFGQWPSSV